MIDAPLRQSIQTILGGIRNLLASEAGTGSVEVAAGRSNYALTKRAKSIAAGDFRLWCGRFPQ
jgi:hypothetical protein